MKSFVIGGKICGLFWWGLSLLLTSEINKNWIQGQIVWFS
jgi:hypothetical protein